MVFDVRESYGRWTMGSHTKPRPYPPLSSTLPRINIKQKPDWVRGQAVVLKSCSYVQHGYGIFMCLLKSLQSPFTITKSFGNKMEKFSERQSPVVSSKQLPYWWIERPFAHLLEHQYHYSCSKHQTKPPAPWIDSPTSALSEKKTPILREKRNQSHATAILKGSWWKLVRGWSRLKPVKPQPYLRERTMTQWRMGWNSKSGHVFVVKRLAQRRDLS